MGSELEWMSPTFWDDGKAMFSLMCRVLKNETDLWGCCDRDPENKQDFHLLVPFLDIDFSVEYFPFIRTEKRS